MSVPLWFLTIWTFSTVAHLAVCFFILKKDLLRSWTSVFLLCADRVVFFLVARYLRDDYAAYFTYYWIDAGIVDLLQIWIVRDIFRSMPSHKWLPSSIRFWTPYCAAIAGLLVARASAPVVASSTIRFVLQINRAAQFSMGAMAICLVLGILTTGFGFSRTGYKVAIGALARDFGAMVLSYIVAATIHPAQNNLVRFANGLDTFISLCVAITWAAAMRSSAADDHSSRLAWELHGRPHFEKEYRR